VRNQFARNMLHADHSAMAVLVGMGMHIDAIRSTTRQLQHATSEHHTAIDNIAQQTLAVSASKARANGAFDSDDYWVAMSRLERAVVSQDYVVLARIGLQGNRGGWKKLLTRFGLKRVVGDSNIGDGGRLSAEAIRFLTSLNKKHYELTPPPDFDDDAYLARNPDVADVVEQGKMSCGFEHYYRFGRQEGRQRPI
jgi:hypothetical protein